MDQAAFVCRTRKKGTEGMGKALDHLASQGPVRHPATATDRASFVQGALLPVDGGRTAV
jgi:hypothetical protein